jgi:hypothetical protein
MYIERICMKKNIVIFLFVMSRVSMCFDDYVEQKISNEQRMPSLLYIASPVEKELAYKNRGIVDSGKSIIKYSLMDVGVVFFGTFVCGFKFLDEFEDHPEYQRIVLKGFFARIMRRTMGTGLIVALPHVLFMTWKNYSRNEYADQEAGQWRVDHLHKLLRRCQKRKEDISQEKGSLRYDYYISPSVVSDRMQCLESCEKEIEDTEKNANKLLKSIFEKKIMISNF